MQPTKSNNEQDTQSLHSDSAPGLETTPAPTASELIPRPAIDNVPAQATPVPAPALDPSLVPPQSSPIAQPTANTTTAPPAAADSDLIEKEWVDKAEQIIETHENDPQAENAAEQDLNKQYLKQRFNFDVDQPDNSPK